MNCNETNQRLNAFLNGSLSGAEARRVREHLAACVDCSKALDSIDRIEIVSCFDEAVEPSADLSARFSARLETHRQEQARAGARRRGASWWRGIFDWSLPRQVAALGALAAVLTLGIYVGLHRVDEPIPAALTNDIPIAENLPLLQDMAVIQNLDLLEDFDAIRNLSATVSTAQ